MFGPAQIGGSTGPQVYFNPTAAVADPPRLGLTAIDWGFESQVSSPSNLPSPSWISVPMIWSVAVTNTVNVDDGSLLYVLTRRRGLSGSNSARSMVTTSAGKGDGVGMGSVSERATTVHVISFGWIVQK